MTEKQDPELKAMGILMGILEPLDNQARLRVLEWAERRFVVLSITLTERDDPPTMKGLEGLLALADYQLKKARCAASEAMDALGKAELYKGQLDKVTDSEVKK